MAGRKTKPQKPYPDYPLFAHANGQWAKKINDRLHYFGVWNEPNAALDKYLRERDYLKNGRTPPASDDTRTTVRDACNVFLTSRKHRLDAGELQPRTFHDYIQVCERVCGQLGKEQPVEDLTPQDFEKLRAWMAAKWGAVTVGNEIQRVKTVFTYAFNAGLIEKPVRFGPDFRRPSRRTIRLARIKNGPRMFEAHELRTVLNEATNPLRAMILLGINCGFGNTDCSGLTFDDLQAPLDWINVARHKTGIPRRNPIWPETCEAIEDWLRARRRMAPYEREDVDLLFLTCQGRPFVRVKETHTDGGVKRTPIDKLGPEMGKLLKRLGIKRRNIGFYALRHTFATIGGESRDQVAVNALMGHVDDSMAGVYRERISDERLIAVSDTVRQWLFDGEDA